MSRTSWSSENMRYEPRCWPRGVTGAFCFLLLSLSGCGGESDARYDEPYTTSTPEHPAMTKQASSTSTVSTAPIRDPHSGVDPRAGASALPPGHPPTSSGSAATAIAPPSGGEAEWEGEGLDLEVAGLKATAPEGWVRERPSNPFRLAQFKLPRVGTDGYDGELTVSVARGSVEDNVRRWQAQFEGSPEVQRESKDVGGLQVLTVQIAGTYLYKAAPMAPGPGAPRTDYRMLAAIVQAPGGQTFFKAWGPKATMEKWQAGFDAMVSSLKNAR